jgi:tetratricopeptide (TPR) repeat protein
MAKTLLIGWDAADWQVLDNLMAQGHMPTLKSFLQRGVRANLATLKPVLSPLLWTSIATGQRAHHHGILGFMQNKGMPAKPVPVQANQRQCPAIWNILNHAQLSTNVINWWPSYPVEELKGIMISNQWATVGPNQPFAPLREADVYPAFCRAFAEELRVHPSELSASHLKPFFPQLTNSELKADGIVANVAHIIAKAASVQAIFTEALEKHPADFNAVYFEALDHLSHLGMKYYPPQLPGVKAEDFEKYQHIVSAGYRFHDMMLERLLELAGPDTNVILVSDHGFESGRQRSVSLPDLPAAPALEHRNLGIFAAMGPAFKPGAKAYGASILDVMPTLLHVHGLPVGDDLPGRVLQDIFNTPRPVSTIPSWQNIVVELPFKKGEAETSKAMLQQLQALGYVDLPEQHRAEAIERDWQYNRAVSLQDANLKEAALQVGEELYQKDKSLRVNTLLADLYLQTGAIENFEKLRAQWPAALENHPYGWFLEGQAHLQKQNLAQALAAFAKIEDKGIASTQLWHEIAKTLWVSGKPEAAEEYWDKILDLAPDYSAALSGKAEIAAQREDWAVALRLLEKSLALRFFQPQAHYLMALSFYHGNEMEAAQAALKICLQQAPKHAKAKFLMAKIGGKPRPKQAETVVVSGFPRSGTSLLMQILQAGGYPVLTDAKRPADAHNPKGYWEYEPVKQLAFSPNALGDTSAQALKIVAPLLPYIPPNRPYAVVWVERPLLEVILSQQRMKKEQQPVQNFPFKLALDYEKEMQRLQNWLNQQPHVRWKIFKYHDFLNQPTETVQALAQFLNFDLKVNQAKTVIDSHLYRNKIG